MHNPEEDAHKEADETPAEATLTKDRKKSAEADEPAIRAPARRTKLTLTVKDQEGQELEIPLDEIEVDARRQRGRRPARRVDYTLCGNCLARIPHTGDPTEDHHAAMRHNVEECTRKEEAKEEHTRLVSQFEQQAQHITPETRKLITEGTKATKHISKTARPRKWKFWKR